MGASTELDRAVSDRLSQHDLRYTTGRRAIVSALRRLDRPATLPDLLAVAPDVTQSSAYRNLSLMEEAGVVRRLVHSADHAHFELAEELTEHHHHMICTECGSVQDFTLAHDVEALLDTTFERVATESGVSISSHVIDLFVTCRDCRST